jgi:hypothetical protein
MRYREATFADAEAIATLHATSWRFAYRGAYSDAYLDGPVFGDRRKVWAEQLAIPVPNQHVIVAEKDGAMVGLACSLGAGKQRPRPALLWRHGRHPEGCGRVAGAGWRDGCRAALCMVGRAGVRTGRKSFVNR